MNRFDTCTQCGEPVDILRRPLKRLRWTRFWWHGVGSIFSQPLRVCSVCGSLYTHAGRLLAPGAAETALEMQVTRYRDDMRGLRDSFGVVTIASGITAGTAIAGLVPGDAVVVAGVVGVLSIIPAGYFGRKVRAARQDLKRLRAARRKGEIIE